MIEVITLSSIAVVVATHNRARLLPRLVEALAKQTDPGLVEVVVVDDASDDDTWDVLSALAATAPFRLTARRMAQNSGPAAACNVGWRATDADVVAFTDDDCVPQAGWLAGLVRGLAEADIVQGRTIPDPLQASRRGPFSHVVEFDEPDGYFETCNIAYRRRMLELVSGFDEAFHYAAERRRGAGPIFGEDADLARRALEHGARTAFDPHALVFHDVDRSSFRARLRKARRLEGLPGLVRADFRELCAERGMGVAKSAQVKAALEIGRRLASVQVDTKYRISTPAFTAFLDWLGRQRQAGTVVIKTIGGVLH